MKECMNSAVGSQRSAGLKKGLCSHILKVDSVMFFLKSGRY